MLTKKRSGITYVTYMVVKGWRALLAVLACLSVVLCGSDVNSVQNRFKRVRSVQFTCLIGPAVSSLNSVRGTEPSVSVQFIQFSSFSSVLELFWPLLDLCKDSGDSYKAVSSNVWLCFSFAGVK